MDDIRRNAQCMCGALRAETRGEPRKVMTCSCKDCRRRSGSAFSVSTYWDADAVVLAGEAISWKRDAQGGRISEGFHCPTCGVTLYWKMDFAPKQIGIGGGNFDNCEFAVPEIAFWIEGRPEWVLDLRNLPALEQQ